VRQRAKERGGEREREREEEGERERARARPGFMFCRMHACCVYKFVSVCICMRARQIGKLTALTRLLLHATLTRLLLHAYFYTPTRHVD
jgi:hypothetical protein